MASEQTVYPAEAENEEDTWDGVIAPPFFLLLSM